MNYSYIIILLLILLIVFFMYYIEPRMSKQKLKNSNEHGSARWSTVQEIKKNFKKESLNNIDKVGFPIYFDKNLKNVWFDHDTPHWVYLGSTGSGKSSTSVLPLCAFIANAKTPKSVFITDPKGEIFSKTSKMFQEKNYNIITIDFRHPENSDKINLLEPCILEYEKYMENENIAYELDNKIIEMKKRKKIYDEEYNYINSDNDFVDKDYYSTNYLLNLEKSKSIIEKLIQENIEKKQNYENKSLYHYAECNRLITFISSMIMNEKDTKDPFWNNSARNLLEGIIGLFLEDYKNKKIERCQITLSAIKKFQNSSMPEENAEIFKSYIESKPYGSKSKDSLTSILASSENTYKSITSVFNEKMSLFDDINVENIISSSSFPLDILGKVPTAFYIIVPDEEKIYFNLITIIIGLLYREITKYANSREEKKTKIEIDWILDEFANCPPLPEIETIISVARSRGLRFHMYIQSFSQLDNVYGKEVAQTILDNSGLAYLKTNTQDTAERISKLLGTKTLETSSINYSLSNINATGSKGTNLIGRPLLTADEIKQLHYKTILFPIVGHPILRDTVFYKKFKIFKDGMIERKSYPLKRFTDYYYTVDDIKSGRNKLLNMKDLSLESQKEKLDNLINNMKIQLDSLQYKTEFYEEENKVICIIGFPIPLSQIKLENLVQLIDEEEYEFNFKMIPDEKYENRLEIKVK